MYLLCRQVYQVLFQRKILPIHIHTHTDQPSKKKKKKKGKVNILSKSLIFRRKKLKQFLFHDYFIHCRVPTPS